MKGLNGVWVFDSQAFRGHGRLAKRGQNPFSSSHIIHPLNNGTHWALLVVDVEEKKLLLFDSIQSTKWDQQLTKIKEKLAAQWKSTLREKSAEWEVEEVRVPQQRTPTTAGSSHWPLPASSPSSALTRPSSPI